MLCHVWIIYETSQRSLIDNSTRNGYFLELYLSTYSSIYLYTATLHMSNYISVDYIWRDNCIEEVNKPLLRGPITYDQHNNECDILLKHSATKRYIFNIYTNDSLLHNTYNTLSIPLSWNAREQNRNHKKAIHSLLLEG